MLQTTSVAYCTVIVTSREKNMIRGQEPWVCSDCHKLQTGNFNLLRRETTVRVMKLVKVKVKTEIIPFYFLCWHVS